MVLLINDSIMTDSGRRNPLLIPPPEPMTQSTTAPPTAAVGVIITNNCEVSSRPCTRLGNIEGGGNDINLNVEPTGLRSNNEPFTNPNCPGENNEGTALNADPERGSNNGGEGNNNGRRPACAHFDYQKNYPIQRFSRKWKRQEVQGLCCLTIEVICLVTLSVISLQGMGYFGNLGEDGHVPHSFSWKILREFYTYEEIPPTTKDCLYLLRGGSLDKKLLRGQGSMGGGGPGGHFGKNVDDEEMDYALINVMSGGAGEDVIVINEMHESPPPDPPTTSEQKASSEQVQVTTNLPFLLTVAQTSAPPLPQNFDANTHLLNSKQCDYKRSRRSTEWLLKMFSSNFMAVLNAFTSALFFASLSVRRRKGLQVILLIPAFLSFFMSIFQQIPTTFHYNYVNLLLRDEMRTALTQSASPHYILPIMEETQIHMQCCGIDHPATWESLGNVNQDAYPGSCCNTTAYDCSGKDTVPKSQVWNVGCYHKQYERVHTYERWSLFILGFKIIAEVGIFCALSDLTRFEYPPPEVVENSRCEFGDYLVKCKGIARIRGVTKDRRIVVSLSVLLAWRLIPSRQDMANGITLLLKNDLNQTKGSIEVIRRLNVETFLHEDIQLDLARKNRGIFVFTLN